VALRALQRIFGVRKNRSRIDHLLIEEQSVEVVAEIVVVTDVPPAARERIRAQAMPDPGRQATKQVRRGKGGVHQAEIPHRQTHQPHEIRRGPVAVHEGLAHSDVGAADRPDKEPFVVDHRHGAQLGRRVAEGMGFVGTDDLEIAALHIAQRAEKEATCDAL
jgi:hypothetical protein